MKLLILDIGLLNKSSIEGLCDDFVGDVALVGNSHSRPDFLHWRSDHWQFKIDVKLTKIRHTFSLKNYAPLDWHEKIFSSAATSLILERTLGNIGLVLQNIVCSRLVDIGFDLYSRYRGEVFWVGTNTPHDQRWILARSLEIGGSKIQFTISSVLHQRVVIAQSLLSQQPATYNADNLDEEAAEKLALKFIEKNNTDYETAIPEYEKERQAKFGVGNKLSLAELTWVAKSSSIAGAIQKVDRLKGKLAAKEFLKVNSKTVKDISQPFVSVFLHFQPERTSIPDAGSFAYQSFIVRSLREQLPKEVTIVLREHPTTFRGNFDNRYRSLEFYEFLGEIPGVVFADCFNENPFDLIDKSLMIATISSTAGSQALSRGIPVICYGPAPYRGHFGCFDMQKGSSEEEFLAWFDAAKDIPRKDVQKLFSGFLKKHILSSYEKEDDINGSINALRHIVLTCVE